MLKFVVLVAVSLPFIQTIAGGPVSLRHCNKALGMQSKAIPDGSLRASSMWDANHGPKYGRLYMKKAAGHIGGWGAKVNDLNQWFQIDLRQLYIVTGLATQGRYANYPQWVTKYKVIYSHNGHKWETVDGGKEFAGNTNQNTVVKHSFRHSIIARYVRVLPKGWNTHITMRMELYGCPKVRGIVVRCTTTHMTIDIPKALLHGLNPKEVRLIDHTCKARMVSVKNKKYYRLSTDLRRCGTKRHYTRHHIHYFNKVTEKPLRRGQKISRDRMVSIPISCSYRSDRAQVSRPVKPDQSTLVLSEHAGGAIPVTLNMYPNARYLPAQKIGRRGPAKKVKLRQRLYFKVKIYFVDQGVHMAAVHCYGSPSRHPNGRPQHDIIRAACPVDPTAILYPRRHGHFRTFSVQAFRLLPKHKYVYFHCKVKLCNGNTGICAKNCARKGKRELSSDEPQSTYTVSHGPIELQDEPMNDDNAQITAQDEKIDTVPAVHQEADTMTE